MDGGWLQTKIGGNIFLGALAGVVIDRASDLIIQWIKNRVSNENTNPKITRVNERGEEKESITINQLDLDESKIRLILRSEADNHD